MWTGLPRPSMVQNVLPMDLNNSNNKKPQRIKTRTENNEISRAPNLTINNYSMFHHRVL